MSSASILIVDDEAAITSALAVLFQGAGYETAVVHGGQEALAYLDDHRPDLIVLDVMMPDVDGHQVCRQIRQRADYIPILMLTARDEPWQQVQGLELGADVYLTKPFAPGTLLAQAKALLRLAAQRQDPAEEARPLTCGPLQVWPHQHRVTVHGRQVTLAPQEFKLLLFLMQRPNQVVGRETLLQQVWGYESDGRSRTVDTHVQRLRAKIEADPAHPQLLQTVHGFGYRLVCA